MRSRWIATWIVVAGLVALVGTVVALNYAFVNGPVSRALAEDPRTAGVEIFAHYAGWINPKVLVLDLRRVERPSPTGLFRAVLQIAAVMADRRLSRVILARSGKQVFYLDGEAFRELGIGYQSGEDAVSLFRTIPEKLHLPDGSLAFRRWDGSSSWVVGEQARDFNAAARAWAREAR